MSDSANYGISGVENLTAGNVVVGSNNRVELHQTVRSLEPQLEDLTRALAGFEGPPDTRNALVDAHAEVVGELRSAKPDKERVLAKLSTIAKTVGSVGTIATAATALAQAVLLVL